MIQRKLVVIIANDTAQQAQSVEARIFAVLELGVARSGNEVP